jgi:hypothetical protein
MIRDKKVAHAVQRKFVFDTLDGILWRWHIDFPSKIILKGLSREICLAESGINR